MKRFLLSLLSLGIALTPSASSAQGYSAQSAGVPWSVQSNVAPGSSSTNYINFVTGSTNTEASRQQIITETGTLSRLMVLTNTSQSALNSMVVTVRVNGVDTALVVTIAASAAAGTYPNTTNTISIAAGDVVSIKIVNNAAATGATIQTLGATFRQ